MKKLFLILLIALVSIGFSRRPRTVEVKNIFFEKNFNDSDVSGLAYEGNPTAKIVNKTAQVILNYTDPINYRTEVKVKGFAEINKTYWYGLKVYIPNDWELDTKPEIIMQWHGVPDFDKGENWRNPVVALYVRGDKHQLGIRADPREVSVKPWEVDKVIELGNIQKGKWVDWIFKIDWSYTNGTIKVWKNKKEIATIYGANCYNDAVGPYFKFGVYKWVWKQGPSDVDSRTLYFDNLRIGKE